MSEKKVWIGIVAGSVLAAAGIGSLIYFQEGDIESARQDIENVKTRINTSRSTIKGTPDLEHEVIVLREISETINQILPTTEDLTNLIDDFYQYATDSSVRSTSFKRKPDRSNGRGAAKAFEKVGYTLTLEGGIFEFLDFLNRIETHSRFMGVPSFKVSSVTRQQLEREGEALHKIQVDVETYTYTTKGTANPVKIDGYARKRDLLAGEINRRRKALTLSTFNYRGDRGRRDPWIDPRVPENDGPLTMPVQEQLHKVDELAAMLVTAQERWTEVQGAQNVLDRMVKKDELAQVMAALDEELRRLESTGAITYVPAQKRLQNEVYDAREMLLMAIEMEPDQTGPRRAEMDELLASMSEHIQLGEYELALQAFNVMEPALDEIDGEDLIRQALAEELRALALEAKTVRDFQNIELEFGGSIIIGDGSPVILINGLSYQIGDSVAPGLEVAAIRKEEVDFYFRGFVLTRVY